MKYVTIYPEYPISIFNYEELKKYRQKVLHSQLEGKALLRVLNGPSKILKTVDGHHINKDYIVGVRDYVDPNARRSELANYERRTQVNLYVSMELVTLDEVSGVICVRRITNDVELCLERALNPTEKHDFAGVLTDWTTTEKLDALIEPGIMKVFEQANLSHSFLAVNKKHIKSFVLVRDLGNTPVEHLLEPTDEGWKLMRSDVS
ncbi:MAG: hypothetical protein JSV26_02980 [bacterium]|nr:MAG: hypothetical protein JSV26_02980 [bacterium]